MTYVEKALLDISSLHAVDEAEHKVWYGGSPDMPEDVTHKVFAFQKLEHVNAGHFVAVPVLQKSVHCSCGSKYNSGFFFTKLQKL